ncbi:MAG: 23S rRNA (guanosine(2251)-2'-O)-methyltransferase RlmB [Desulfobacterales bacterium]
MKTEILYGFHPVYEALRAGRRTFHEIYISKQPHARRIERIRAAADRKNILLKEASPAKLQAIGGPVSHQGVMARVTAYPLADTADLLGTVLSGTRPPFFLLLDQIVDPHNLGAIIRTGLCAGIDGVIIPKDRSAYPTPAVSRISAGALEYMRVAQVNNMVRFVRALKDQDVWIVGLDQNAGQPIYGTDLTGAVGLVVGGEEKGIRPLVKRNCDFLISIPQCGPVGSLNASVAAAIAMYELYRQRLIIKNAQI